MKTYRMLIALGLPGALLCACAYQRPAEVTAQMARTEAVMQQAERSGAQENALPEFQSARDKYADARKAMEKNSEKGDRDALRLARQAEVDAQFAAAKSHNTRQQSAATEVKEGVDALRDEAARNSGSSAPTPAN